MSQKQKTENIFIYNYVEIVVGDFKLFMLIYYMVVIFVLFNHTIFKKNKIKL